MLDSKFWHDRSVLVTGHTGFKGSWISCLLNQLGAKVYGYALAHDPETSPFQLIEPIFADQAIADVRDQGRFAEFVDNASPSVVIHMAAQALVRESYSDPLGTFDSNMIGTIKILEVLRDCPSVDATLVVTTDKVYENRETGLAFVEDDRLGGNDPYSASKACVELAVASYRHSFFASEQASVLATARSGNVIGGGDYSVDRIIPDLVRAIGRDEDVVLRNPQSVRPWLHVLEPTVGYLLMVQYMGSEQGQENGAVNFAPDDGKSRTVQELVERFVGHFNHSPGWRRDNLQHPYEANLLMLDPGLAGKILDWRPVFNFDQTVDWTASWYREHLAGGDMAAFTRSQIDDYLSYLSDLGRATL